MRPGTHPIPGAVPLLLGATVTLLCGGCDHRKSSTPDRDDSFFKDAPEVVADVHKVRLSSEPTDFLRRHAEASIHWQPWSRELFAHAEAEQRPIFLVVASGRYKTCFRLLEKMDADPVLIREMHENYVCALADPEARPELGLLAARLSAERSHAVQFPFIAWISYEGNPVAWLPLRPRDVEDFGSVWENSHAMVSKIWSESPRYVIFNSRRDNANRTTHLAIGAEEPVGRPAAMEAARDVAGRIAALYDPASNSIDGSGGLVPLTAVNFAATLALDPATPPGLQPRLTRLVEGLGATILKSSVVDPLDRGMFVGRRAQGWALPVFTKDSGTQSAATGAYARGHALTGSREALAGAVAFAKVNDTLFGEGGQGIGDYLALLGRTPDGRGFLWTQERLKELLSPDEFEVATAVFGISGLGNIPAESDPRRFFFRRNSLGMAMSLAEAATTLGRPEAEVRTLFESARRRLLAQRRELLQRAEHLIFEGTRITAVNARHARALTTLAQVSGDSTHLERARKVIDFLKARHYSEDGGLMRIAASTRHQGVAARGEDYALLLDALLALYRLDLDPAHLHWAEALAAETLAKLGDEDAILLETPEADRFGIFPIIHDAMVFGPSTWGTIYNPLGQLQRLGPRPEFEALLAAIRSRLVPALQKSHPFIHTDFAAGVIAEARDCLLLLEGDPEEAVFREMHQAAAAPEFDGITIVHLVPGLPAAFQLPEPTSGPKARIRRNGEDLGEALTAASLQQLLRETLASE